MQSSMQRAPFAASREMASREIKRPDIWLQVLSHVDPQYGGIAMSVPQLARYTEEESSLQCPIAGFCDSAECKQLPVNGRRRVKTFPPDRMGWMVDTSLRKRLRETILAARGVHIHGIWEAHSMVVAGLARASKRPYVISAHGMLEPWALRNKRVKKALYAALIEIRGMQRAACLRALTIDEVDDYRRLGLTTPIAIVPSGTDVHADQAPDLFWQQYPSLQGKRIVLFLGRLNPKKGLRLLLQAWHKSRQGIDDVHLVIAGPDSDNMRASLEQMTDELNLRSSVTFAGMLTDERKWSALAAAKLFVLPSYSEGFSIAVLEALGMGLPVLVTKPCHIPEVVIHECGWVIEPDLRALESALGDFFSLSELETANMGGRGRDLVRQHFRWSVIGRKMAQVYEWLQGGPKPSEVEIV